MTEKILDMMTDEEMDMVTGGAVVIKYRQTDDGGLEYQIWRDGHTTKAHRTVFPEKKEQFLKTFKEKGYTMELVDKF